MAQNEIIFSDDPSGSQLLDGSDKLTGFRENFLTTNSGNARPSYAQEDTLWIDKSSSPFALKRFTGTDDVIIGYFDDTALEFLNAGALSANSVTNAMLAQVTGPVIKGRDTGTGNVQDLTPAQLSNLLTVTGLAAAMLFSRGNILGTVSQSGGVPTGAIVQRISNANGEAVRYADGTQICWNPAVTSLNTNTATGSVFTSAATSTWTFPAAFSATPHADCTVPAASTRWGNASSTSTTSVDLRIFAGASSATATAVAGYAIGRWF